VLYVLDTIFLITDDNKVGKRRENVIKIIRKKKIHLQYCTVSKKNPGISGPPWFKAVLFKGQLYINLSTQYLFVWGAISPLL